ncbi:MAG: hypothetical protein HPY71_12510 [Firmicutes bacterium]|nr:hypothetical protein [Bacillota bacterium]
MSNRVEYCARKNDTSSLFPMDLPAQEWVEFFAEGFSRPVSGVIYRRDSHVVSGMPLGAIDTGCIDLETSGLFGYSTIFNSHIPRGGPINLPFLGMSVGGQTWVFTTKQTKTYHDTAINLNTLEPAPSPWGKPGYAPPDLDLVGVQTVKDIHYWGHYPVADLEYEMDAPISVGLRAWAPFIPGDIEASLLPGAVFEVQLRNTSDVAQQGAIVFSFPGPDEVEAGTTQFERKEVTGQFSGVTVTTKQSSYALGVVGEEKLRIGGALGNDGAAWAKIASALPTAAADHPGASVAVDFALSPGETRVVRFILAWYSPKWKGSGTLGPVALPAIEREKDRYAASANYYTHMYATRYKGALEAAEILAKDHGDLLKRILAWQEAVYTASELPGWLRDSLVNILHLITEDGLWAVAEFPIGDWCRPEDGLYGMIECPRGCPQIECIPCSFYGNIPLVYFFPELALSTLRGYKAYQFSDGAAPWIFGGCTGRTGPIEMVYPTAGYQTTLNGPCYVDMVDRLWLRTGDEKIVREFYPSVKKNTIFTMNLRPEYEMGDQVISMPSGNVGSEWFEAPEPEWSGMVAHVGGIHLANLRMAERMAEAVGDKEFAAQCRQWLGEGSKSMENKMWAGEYYLNYYEPETDRKADLIFGYQLDGEWMARFHGLSGVFRPDRVKTTLATIKRANIALTRHGAVNYANSDGSVTSVKGYGPYSMFPPEVLMLAMTYMYNGEKEFGLELARRCWHNIVCKQGLTWDQPNIFRGDADTGERVFGADYYQNMILWSLPAAMEGKDLRGPVDTGGLVDRVINAGKRSS